MPRIFCNVPIDLVDHWSLPADAVRHIQVLRLQPGGEFTLFNGKGGEFTALILEMTRKEVIVSIKRFNPIERELKTSIHLAIGMPANERMDWLIEKATELGLTKLTPLMTQHNVVRLDSIRGEKKTQHWNTISATACTQCGRNTTPLIDNPIGLSHWLKSFSDNLNIANDNITKWFFSLDSNAMSLGAQIKAFSDQAFKSDNKILIAFGPEGGWSKDEELLLETHGFKALSLGNRTLRAETAAIATLAAISLML